MAAAGKKHCRLAGGVAATHDDGLIALTQLSFQMRGRVINARAGVLRQILELRLSILRAGRDDHRPRARDATIGQLDAIGPSITMQLDGIARDIEARAELL